MDFDDIVKSQISSELDAKTADAKCGSISNLKKNSPIVFSTIKQCQQWSCLGVNRT